jgi:hypothetical protein
MNTKPLPINNALIFYNDVSYEIYNNIVYKLFPDLLDVNAKSLDALVPIVRPLSPREKYNPLNRTAYKDLLSKAVEALRY